MLIALTLYDDGARSKGGDSQIDPPAEVADSARDSEREPRRSLLDGWKLPKGDGDDPDGATDGRPGSDDDATRPQTDADEMARKQTGGDPATALTDDPLFGRGRIAGRITHSGTLPEDTPINMSSDPKCVRITEALDRVHPKLERSKEGGLIRAVVWVRGVVGAYPIPRDPLPFLIRDCRFPSVVALQVQQDLEITNGDPTLHNVHGHLQRAEFIQAIPRQGQVVRKKAKVAEQSARISCDVHAWEESRAFVFDHPFFTVTDADGRFSIDRLPGDGPWSIVVSHPVAGAKELSVDGKSEVQVHFAKEQDG